MSQRLAARAEVLKLARLLAVEPGELEFLQDLPPGELRQFRELATDRLFDAGARALSRVGAAAKLLPSGLVATIAQHAFGPLLCARAAGAVDTDKAIDVAQRLPPEFLADVTVELDPRRVAEIIAKVPESLVVGVAGLLGQRREHVTMGRFIAYVPDHAIAAAIGALDNEAVLRTAFVLEDKDRIDHAIGLLPPHRLPGILRDAARLAIWPEALDLLDHLSVERRGAIADVVAGLDGEIVAGLVAAVHEAGLWDALLPVVRVMSAEPRRRMVSQPAFHDPAVLSDVIRVSAEQGLWRDLVPLIDAVPADVRVIVARIAANLPPALLANVVAQATDSPHTIPTLLGILHDMDAESRARIVGQIDADPLIAQQDETVIGQIVATVSTQRLWDALLPIVRTIGPQTRQRLAEMPAFHDRALLTEIVTAAAEQGLWRELVPLIEAIPEAVRITVAEVATGLEPELLANVLAEAAQAPETLATLLSIVRDMTPNGRTAVAALIDDADKRIADDLVGALNDDQRAHELLEAMPDEIAAAIDRAAQRHGHQSTLARIRAADVDA